MRMMIGITFVLLSGLLGSASGRDLDRRYANSPLHDWFNQLASGKGPCCSVADGLTVADPDWEAQNGHYRVRIENKWLDVPDDAVITVPNLAGRTMVWPLASEDRTSIRCFMPGSMT